MTKFIIRVDDVGQAPNQDQPDAGLEYFLKWHKAAGLDGLPCCLGVVPAPGPSGEPLDGTALLELHSLAERGAEICLHGWDHAKQPLSADHIRRGASEFPKARCVIPPFNSYDAATFDGMARWLTPRRSSIMLGGFNGEHHTYGCTPRWVGPVLHFPAQADLYERAYLLTDVIKRQDELYAELGGVVDPLMNHPQVITLHHRWESEMLGSAKPLIDLIRDRLIGLDEAILPYLSGVHQDAPQHHQGQEAEAEVDHGRGGA